ncbi:MAG TPA: DUF3305 domain-containing protein [Steroidobacteraceae bacterium]|nr:DUF3305 domain-containing protein [Steroidobacteraceae bacterium]
MNLALARIPVGVVVERRRAESPWLEFLHRPVAVLAGVPVAEPWTVIRSDGDTTTLYAGQAMIELHRTETGNYRDNLASGTPLLWVILRPTSAEAGFDLLMVTADPAEGEALTGAGNDLVEAVPMPVPISEIVASFIAEHHVERAFFKRRRNG